jgi:hypothetical protein
MALKITKHQIHLVTDPQTFDTHFVVDNNVLLTLTLDALEQLHFDIEQVLPRLRQQAGSNRPTDD